MSEFVEDINAAGTNTVAYWKQTWASNTVLNYPVTIRGMRSGRVADMGQHIRQTRAPAYLLCSGPTLDNTPWDKLKALQTTANAGVFTATSNVNVALANGLTPTYTIVVDANHTLWDHIKDSLDLLGDTEFLTSPIVEPKLLAHWPGKVSMFKPLQFGDDFIMSTLPAIYSKRYNLDPTHRVFIDLLTVSILNAGCVTNAMFMAASYLGYDPIFLLGNDLGFPGGRGRCLTYTRKDGVWVADPPMPVRAKENLRTATNGVRTISEYLHYKLNLFISWRLTPSRLYNTSFEGILHDDEIPMVHVEDAIDKWATLGYPMDPGSKQWHSHVQTITERMGMRMVQKDNGYVISPLSLESVGVPIPETHILRTPSTGVVSSSTPRVEGPPHA